MKGWADYLLESLGLGLITGCMTLAGLVIFGDPSVGKGLLVFGLVFGVFAGLRLATGRSEATQKPGKGQP